MCTRVLWSDDNGLVLAGRNMDFYKDLMTNLWTQPRGIERNDGVHGDLKWTSKYGSIVATCFDIVSVDGLNEAGLAGHILWLAESEYGELQQERPKLSQAIWLQYFLDNFATVAEAVTWINATNVQVVQMDDPTGGVPLALHLALEDATGDSCIIEYVGGKAVVYHSAEYQVMTNSPTYDQQLELVKGIDGLGGTQPIPGSTKASDRFARASYYVSRLPQPKTEVQAVASMMSVMRNAAQPFRIPDPEAPEASQTLWQVVIDLTNKRYVFESTTRPNIVWVNMKDLNLAAGADQMKLDLVEDLTIENGIVSEVSNEFKKVGELKFFTVDMKS